MAYGTERFLAGGGGGLTLHIFDFRWPKSYYHTAGLPCLAQAPFPRPHQPFMKRLPTPPNPGGLALCSHHPISRPCPYHALARTLYYRPNAKLFLSESLRSFRSSSVWSLARASDVAPNFYVGVSGGVIEATLEQTPDTYPTPPPPNPPTTTTTTPDDANANPVTVVVDPNFGFPDWRAAAHQGSGYKTRPLVPALMETGDGYSFEGNDRSILLPGLVKYRGPPGEGMGQEGGRGRWHRLDGGYWQEGDFGGVLNGV